MSYLENPTAHVWWTLRLIMWFPVVEWFSIPATPPCPLSPMYTGYIIPLRLVHVCCTVRSHPSLASALYMTFRPSVYAVHYIPISSSHHSADCIPPSPSCMYAAHDGAFPDGMRRSGYRLGLECRMWSSSCDPTASHCKIMLLSENSPSGALPRCVHTGYHITEGGEAP